MPTMRQNWLHSLVCVWTAGAVAAGGCRTQPGVNRPGAAGTALQVSTPAGAAQRAHAPIVGDHEDGVLTAQLGDAPVAQSKAVIAALSPGETQALLARMEPLPDVSRHPAPVLR